MNLLPLPDHTIDSLNTVNVDIVNVKEVMHVLIYFNHQMHRNTTAIIQFTINK